MCRQTARRAGIAKVAAAKSPELLLGARRWGVRGCPYNTPAFEKQGGRQERKRSASESCGEMQIQWSTAAGGGGGGEGEDGVGREPEPAPSVQGFAFVCPRKGRRGTHLAPQNTKTQWEEEDDDDAGDSAKKPCPVPGACKGLGGPREQHAGGSYLGGRRDQNSGGPGPGCAGAWVAPRGDGAQGEHPWTWRPARPGDPAAATGSAAASVASARGSGFLLQGSRGAGEARGGRVRGAAAPSPGAPRG